MVLTLFAVRKQLKTRQSSVERLDDSTLVVMLPVEESDWLFLQSAGSLAISNYESHAA